MKPIYLDNNATTPILPEVWERMAACATDCFANPGSPHALGRQARRALEEAREGIARLLGVWLGPPHHDRLVFTGGGTEANNLAVLGQARPRMGRIAYSELEHPSVLRAARVLEESGVPRHEIECRSDGRMDLSSLGSNREESVAVACRDLVCCVHANSETGVMQSISEAAAAAHSMGATLHVDAAQTAGKVPIDFRALGADTLSIAAHKFNGPRGIGALAIRGGVELSPMTHGGPQEFGLRGGTESPYLAAGMFEALRLWNDHGGEWTARLRQLREEFEGILTGEIESLTIFGASAERLPHTSLLGFPGVSGEALLMALDLEGVACSTGTACASGSAEPSPALLAMGVARDDALRVVRFSLGVHTRREETIQATIRIISCYNQLRRSNPAR